MEREQGGKKGGEEDEKRESEEDGGHSLVEEVMNHLGRHTCILLG